MADDTTNQTDVIVLGAGSGDVRHAEIRSIISDGDGWRVVLPDGDVCGRHVVVALGPWSADLLRPLGYRVPPAAERGYHREFRPNPSRNQPIGFTIGPATGEAIAATISGAPPPFDVASFAPSRYI